MSFDKLAKMHASKMSALSALEEEHRVLELECQKHEAIHIEHHKAWLDVHAKASKRVLTAEMREANPILTSVPYSVEETSIHNRMIESQMNANRSVLNLRRHRDKIEAARREVDDAARKRGARK